MKINLRHLLSIFVLLTGIAINTQAEIKSVQMKIDGYLCGN